MNVECSADLKARHRPRGCSSDPATWRPPACPARIPDRGVTLGEGSLLKQSFDCNVAYLLHSFSVDEMLYACRLRAGIKDPPSERDIHKLFGFWTEGLRGSEAGRFLMGAANSLHWTDHPELRRRLVAVVDGVAACQETDGYVYAFDRDKPRHCEQGNYARNWFTQGMLDAGSVYPRAYDIMRRGHDWFNRCDWLDDLIYLSLGLQGHPASLSMYLSPVGKPEDVQVAERHYVQDWWLEQLRQRDPAAVWKYPLNRPHCYEIAGFEAYLDHYLVTGDQQYLDAMLGAWDLMRDNWQHIGGAWAICEGKPYPPQSYRLDCTGELCGSVFWIKFCQRFHRLFPDEEKYAAEIEKSIYNIALANQAEDGIRYHALLDGHKEKPNAHNTCCELHGTRIYAALPEYVFTLRDGGVVVNLFTDAALDTMIAGQSVRLTMTSTFPLGTAVRLAVQCPQADDWTLWVRAPQWASAAMGVHVNGTPVGEGQPGTYLPITRTWRDGDEVTFDLPASFRMEPYVGEDLAHWSRRYALLYGPVLMATVGPLEEAGERRQSVILRLPPEELIRRLTPIPSRPLHYRIAALPGYEVLPYWQIGYESFSAVPVFRP